MSEEQLKAFLEAVKADTGLQEKLNGAADADVVVDIAKDAGFMISADELAVQWAQSEVSEEELELIVVAAQAHLKCNSILRSCGTASLHCN